MNEKALDLLIYSLDNELNPNQKVMLDQFLSESAELRAEKEQLLKMRHALSEIKETSHSYLSEAILNKIEAPQEAEFQAIIMQLFPKVAAACVLVIMVTIFATYYYTGSLSAEAMVGIQNLSPEDAYSLMQE